MLAGKRFKQAAPVIVLLARRDATYRFVLEQAAVPAALLHLDLEYQAVAMAARMAEVVERPGNPPQLRRAFAS